MKSLFLFFLVAFALTPLAAQEPLPIRIGGSDLFAPSFEQTLREYATEQGIEIEIELSGSYAARKDIQNNQLDIAILAIPGQGQPQLEGGLTFPFAYKTVIFAVSDGSPITQLSLAQVRSIFGSDESDSITRWQQLGLSGQWTARSISLYSISPSEGLAIPLFLHQVLNTPRTRTNISYSESFSALLERVRNDQGGIALLPKPPSNGAGLRSLSIARTDEDFAFGPTAENIHADDYPIRLPIFLFVTSNSERELGPILDFLISDPLAQQIEASGLIPLPANVRNRLRFDFERL